MSGIVGIFNLEGRPVDRTNLQSMVDILAHRGPDGADIWCDGSIGLGHCMLWTTPESLLEKLPMMKGSLTITADARIDNREELIPVLGLADYPAEKITDVDLILAAYEQWGEDCPKHLLGDFAFAIWDGRSQHLFCARDHIGIKPFYYYYLPGRLFAFASEIKSLLHLNEASYSLNEAKIAKYLVTDLEDKSITFFKEIFRLLPASWMCVNPQKTQFSTYWSLDPDYELKLQSDEDYAEALREIFTKSVECRLRSAFPIGSHLSGGLDSTSVTCVAQEILRKNGEQLHTFSNIFEIVSACDERVFVEKVVADKTYIPHYINADEIGPLSDLDRIFSYHDEPFFGPTYYLVWGLNQAAQSQDIRIVLDGFDGDTTLSHGDGYFYELVVKEQWSTLVKEAKETAQLINCSHKTILRQYALPYLEELAKRGKIITFIRVLRQISYHLDVSKQKLFLYHGLKPLLPNFIRRLFKLLSGKYFIESPNEWLINKHRLKHSHLKNSSNSFKISPYNIEAERDYHYKAITTGMVTAAMETLDQSAAAFSLEARHPFMDKRLLEFCLSIPPNQKLRHGWTRWIMRQAMSGILPKELQWRRQKSNMSPSFLYGLLTLNQQILNELMQSKLDNISNYINVTSLKERFKNIKTLNKLKKEEEELTLATWKSILLSFWLHSIHSK